MQILLLIVVMITLLGCKKKSELEAIKSKYVRLYEIEEIVTSQVRTFPGKVVEAKKANLSFRIAAPIDQILVSEGEYVKTGQVLAKLDTRDYDLQLEATKAQYEQVSSEVARIETLYAKGNISDNDYEKAKSGLKMITAKYQNAQNSLADIELKAPYSGFIQDIYFQAGEIVSAGLPIITLISDQDFQIECDIPAIVYANRDKFESFTVALETSPAVKVPLSLVNIKHKSNLNSLYHVYFKLSDNRQSELRLASGMDCELEISYGLDNADKQQVVKVPVQAIVEESGVNYVWLCEVDAEGQHRVKKREIEVIGIDESGFALIKDGLDVSCKIVKAGVYDLQEGQVVNLVDEIAPTNYGGLL